MLNKLAYNKSIIYVVKFEELIDEKKARAIVVLAHNGSNFLMIDKNIVILELSIEPNHMLD